MVEEDQTSLVISNKYTVRLAQTEEELQKAQSLRYLVFNIELDEGLEQSHNQQLDIDKYDSQCDHLLVIDHEEDKVIGTYRMQTFDQANEHLGFYTADEFSLWSIPEKMLNQSVEVGRACIHQDHRNGRVLYLLWRGIAKYMQMKSARYLFGCCSLSSTNPKEGWIAMDYLKHNNHMHQELYVDTTPDYHCPESERSPDAWQDVNLPQLFRLYLGLGAKVLSRPALDHAFKTIDFLIVVDINELDAQTRTLFFK